MKLSASANRLILSSFLIPLLRGQALNQSTHASSLVPPTTEWANVDFGLIIEASDSVPLSLPMQRRSTTSSNLGTRDIGKRMVDLSFDEVNGEIIWPSVANLGGKDRELERRSHKHGKEHKHHHKQHHHHKSKGGKGRKGAQHAGKKGQEKKKSHKSTAFTSELGIKLAAQIPTFKSVITWYTGHDLLNPYCAQNSGWTPTDSSMIAAVTEHWGSDRPVCGSFLRLTPTGSTKNIVVRVVDLCGGCKPGIPHVDLSQAAFKSLYGLEVGEVSGIQVSTLDGNPVSGQWTDSLVGLYGPEKL